MRKNSIWLAVALAQIAAPVLAAGTWHFDKAHTSAQFKIKHLMVSNVTGTIGGASGTAEYDGKNVKNMHVDATLDLQTLTTNEPTRDKHLRSADFFDAAKYPTIAFKSKKVQPVGHDKYKVIGDLTMHGVTKEVTLDMDAPTSIVKDPQGNEHVGTEAHTTVNRSDFGLTWNKTLDQGGVVVGEPVDITIDIDLVKDKETASKEPSKQPG